MTTSTSLKPAPDTPISAGGRARASVKVFSKRVKRHMMLRAIRNLASWQPLTNPEPGYTVVIACMRELASIATANITAVARMNLTDMRELLLVFDCTESELPPSVVSLVASLRDRIPVRILSYSPEQQRTTAKLRWGWVYAWLSWSIGVGAAKTRHVILHDLDALPLNPHLFDERYKQAVQAGSTFHGVRWYHGNGITESMRLVVTFELVLDAAHMRRSFRPFHVFNHVALVGGHYVDFDTFLYTQWKSEGRTVQALPESQLVHPTQMICQYTDFVAGRERFETKGHNLLLIPYYSFLGGDRGALEAVSDQCADPNATTVPFAGLHLPLTHMAPSQWAWLEKQIRRTEQALFKRTRPEVERYLAGFISRAGDKRTVGAEHGESAVAAR